MQNFSLHNHTTFSDGIHSVAEVVQEAEKMGLKHIGISDHLFLREKKKWMLSQDDLPEYVKEIRNIKEKSNINVLLGAEVDLPITQQEWITCRKIKRLYGFDFFIGSYHPFPNDKDRENMKNRHDTIASLVQEHRSYWNSMNQLATNDAFEIIAHADIIKMCGVKTEEILLPQILIFLELVKHADKILEVNTSGYDEIEAQETCPSPLIVQKSIEMGIPLIISSDAHRKDDITRNFDKAEKLINGLAKGEPKRITTYNPKIRAVRLLNQLGLYRK